MQQIRAGIWKEILPFYCDYVCLLNNWWFDLPSCPEIIERTSIAQTLFLNFS